MGQALIRTCAVFALVASAGCATVPVPVENPRQVWCDHSQPRRDATVDTPRAELDEINSHNAQGSRWCGWEP